MSTELFFKSKGEILFQTNIEGISAQQSCLIRNVKRGSSQRRKMVEVSNWDVYEERKGTGEGKNESRIKYFTFLTF